jgi:hypothetical protein
MEIDAVATNDRFASSPMSRTSKSGSSTPGFCSVHDPSALFRASIRPAVPIEAVPARVGMATDSIVMELYGGKQPRWRSWLIRP